MMNKFTEIPMRTWNWLKVNEAVTTAEIETSEINVSAGETRKIILTSLEANETAKKIHVKVEREARAEVTCVDLSHSNSFCEIIIELDGDNSSCDLFAAYFADGERKVDLNYIIRQIGIKTDAVMNVRGALSGKAEKTFRGTLDFIKGTKGSVGREREEVILLSDSVKNKSVPLMLSHEDDVDGHHAVSIGQIDENKLFYLMSRGLDINEAKRLIVEAAFAPALERIEDNDLKEQINSALAAKLN